MAASARKIQLTSGDGIRVLKRVLSIRTGAGDDVGSCPPGACAIQLQGCHHVSVLVSIDDGKRHTALRFVISGGSIKVSVWTKMPGFEVRRLDADIQRDFA